MKQLLIILLGGICIGTFAQKSITFKIEDKSKPERLLFNRQSKQIWENLILAESHTDRFDIDHKGLKFDYNIITQSQTPDSLVAHGYNSFFYGMFNAYADHRPFELSPDMIWLLICQGFAHHVNAEPEKLRSMFVSHEGQLSLVVKSKEISLNSPPEAWEKIFPQFTKKIAEHTGDELMNTLTANFTTTTPVEKVAIEITAMYAMKPYFKYHLISCMCGIPEITLEGTPEDWQSILDKTKKLEKYDLQWWTSELEPILLNIIATSKGTIDTVFWRNMFKYHSKENYGAPKIIDGWIVKFFPYDKDGKRFSLKELTDRENLAEEIIKVDLQYLEENDGLFNQTPLELWAGFVGLEQNKETFALRPKIAWMIKKKDGQKSAVVKKMEIENTPGSWDGDGINLEIDQVPDELQQIERIYTLELHFKKWAKFPRWFKTAKIDRLVIYGKISPITTLQLRHWFPNTVIQINQRVFHKNKNGWVSIDVPTYNPQNWTIEKGKGKYIEDLTVIIPPKYINIKNIKVLDIQNTTFDDSDLIFPDSLKNYNIEVFSFLNQISKHDVERITSLFPNAKIYAQGQKLK